MGMDQYGNLKDLCFNLTRGRGSCRNLPQEPYRPLPPQAYGIRAQVPPKIFGVQNGGFKGGGGSQTPRSDGSGFLFYWHVRMTYQSHQKMQHAEESSYRSLEPKES
jgi:hypothetical protein